MASVALLVLSTNHPTTLGFAMLLILLVGSMVYLCGFALWHQRLGRDSLDFDPAVAARALMAFTLRAAPDDRAPPVAQVTTPTDR